MDQQSRGRRRNTKFTSKENLDLVKAAAHAWYEHGSHSSLAGRKVDMCTFDTSGDIYLTQSSQPGVFYENKPSRFKVEAAVASSRPTFHGCGNVNKKCYTLLDEYEIGRIVQYLDDYPLTSKRREAGREEIGDKSEKQLLVKKENMSIWAKRGLVCTTYMNDVVVATRRIPKSTGGSSLKQTNFKVMQV